MLARLSEVLGEIVAHLRAERLAGVPVSQLVAQLQQQGLDLPQVNEHFREAFSLSGPADLIVLKRASGDRFHQMLDEYVGPMIDTNLGKWKAARAYPDLMRRRDRHAFKEAARRTGYIFVVCAAEAASGQYIGRPGFTVFPIHPFVNVRRSPPNEGLVAAEPGDAVDPYGRKLESLGLAVGLKEDGFIVRDRAGTAFYPGYYLHGVYEKEGGSNAWTGNEGERIRASLNRAMGQELVLFGPHDIWDQRLELDEDSPLRGPRSPVLFFLPNGSVEVRHDARTMELYYRFLGIDWDSLYPAPAPVQGTIQ
jgi:hypothetical protein